jgi:hypothetical protein
LNINTTREYLFFIDREIPGNFPYKGRMPYGPGDLRIVYYRRFVSLGNITRTVVRPGCELAMWMSFIFVDFYVGCTGIEGVGVEKLKRYEGL